MCLIFGCIGKRGESPKSRLCCVRNCEIGDLNEAEADDVGFETSPSFPSSANSDVTIGGVSETTLTRTAVSVDRTEALDVRSWDSAQSCAVVNGLELFSRCMLALFILSRRVVSRRCESFPLRSATPSCKSRNAMLDRALESVLVDEAGEW